MSTRAVPENTHADTAKFHMGVDEALAHILSGVAPTPIEEYRLSNALGLSLASGAASGIDVPQFANSAMDGFAFRARDTNAASDDSPVTLTVIGDVPAGSIWTNPVPEGCAVRIMTGAPVPDGLDSVIKVEETETLVLPDGSRAVAIPRPVCHGDCIRQAGEDVRAGDTIIHAGTPLRSAEIGLLAATGFGSVQVHRRPRVGIIITGDELVPAGEQLSPGKIWNSNGPMIASQVRESGGEAIELGIAADAADTLRARLRDAGGLDMLITTGGVSVGDFDVVKQVLQEEGRIDLWNLRMKPGKPLAFGWIGDTPLIGLPGNPVAAAVTFWQFAYPMIQKMLGRKMFSLPTVRARLADTIDNYGKRTQYVRVTLEQGPDGMLAYRAGGQGSHILTALAHGNGLLVIPEHYSRAEAGATFEVQVLP